VLSIAKNFYHIDITILLCSLAAVLRKETERAGGGSCRVLRIARMTLKVFEFRIVFLFAARDEFVADGIPGIRHL
jgi:hypothetical protein